MTHSSTSSPDPFHATSLPNWYPTHQPNTLKTHIIPLPANFVSFLHQDGIFMDSTQFLDAEESVRYDKDDKYQDDDAEEPSSQEPLFHDVQQQIMDIMKKLDTNILFPKTNWSAPKDACYMTSYNTLKIDSIEELFRILKASDFVAFDLKKAQELGETPVLCLRKHYDIRLSTEFRCFVKGGELVAVSQRDMTNYYKFLAEERDAYLQEIRAFFEKNIKGKFELQDYVVDLYKSRTDRWWIIDFNVWGLPTHPLMFETWEAVEEIADEVLRGDKEPEIRILDQQPMMQPSFQQYSGMPIDLARVENLNEFFEELQRQEQERQNEGVFAEDKNE